MARFKDIAIKHKLQLLIIATPIVTGRLLPGFSGLRHHKFVERENINGRPVSIRRLKPRQDLIGRRIANIRSEEKYHWRAIFENANRVGVLTVEESEGFAACRGIIGFIREEHKVHFGIDIDAAQRANLKISSKLLGLARIVGEQDLGGKN